MVSFVGWCKRFRDPILCLEKRPMGFGMWVNYWGNTFPPRTEGFGLGSINVGMIGPKWWEVLGPHLAFLSFFLSPPNLN